MREKILCAVLAALVFGGCASSTHVDANADANESSQTVLKALDSNITQKSAKEPVVQKSIKKPVAISGKKTKLNAK